MAISTRHTVGNSDGYQPNLNILKHKWDQQIWQYRVCPTIKRIRCSTPTVLGNISRMEVKSIWRASKLTEWLFPDLMAIVGPLWTSLVLPQSFLGVVNLLSTLVFLLAYTSFFFLAWKHDSEDEPWSGGKLHTGTMCGLCGNVCVEKDIYCITSKPTLVLTAHCALPHIHNILVYLLFLSLAVTVTYARTSSLAHQ